MAEREKKGVKDYLSYIAKFISAVIVGVALGWLESVLNWACAPIIPNIAGVPTLFILTPIIIIVLAFEVNKVKPNLISFFVLVTIFWFLTYLLINLSTFCGGALG